MDADERDAAMRALAGKMKSILVRVVAPYVAPGSSTAAPSGLLSAAAPITLDR